jgi:hypothetical protein
VQSGRTIPMFRRNLIPPFSRYFRTGHEILILVSLIKLLSILGGDADDINLNLHIFTRII